MTLPYFLDAQGSIVKRYWISTRQSVCQADKSENAVSEKMFVLYYVILANENAHWFQDTCNFGSDFFP